MPHFFHILWKFNLSSDRWNLGSMPYSESIYRGSMEPIYTIISFICHNANGVLENYSLCKAPCKHDIKYSKKMSNLSKCIIRKCEDHYQSVMWIIYGHIYALHMCTLKRIRKHFLSKNFLQEMLMSCSLFCIRILHCWAHRQVGRRLKLIESGI